MIKIGDREFDESSVIAMQSTWKRDAGAAVLLVFEDGQNLEYGTRDKDEAETIRKHCQAIAKAINIHPLNF